MQTRTMRRVGFFAAVALLMPLGSVARAGDLFQATIIEEGPTVNLSDIHLLKPGNFIKITPAPPTKPGTGLAVLLNLKNVDCVTEGNDLAKTGKCGVAAHPPAVAVPVPAVMGLGVHLSGVDILNVFGIPIQFTKGVATFAANGKNKIDGSAFGTFISAVLGQRIGFQVVTIRPLGSVPGDCNSAPAGPGCLDAAPIAFTGMTSGL